MPYRHAQSESNESSDPTTAQKPDEVAARSAMISALRSRGQGSDTLTQIHESAAMMVREASKIDPDISGTARGAIAGAIDACRQEDDEIDVDEARAARAAAMGALEAAGDVSESAVEHVKKVIVQPIRGVKPVDESLFRQGRRLP